MLCAPIAIDATMAAAMIAPAISPYTAIILNIEILPELSDSMRRRLRAS